MGPDCLRIYRLFISVDFDSLFYKLFQQIHFCPEQRLCLTEMTVIQPNKLLLSLVESLISLRPIGLIDISIWYYRPIRWTITYLQSVLLDERDASFDEPR